MPSSSEVKELYRLAVECVAEQHGDMCAEGDELYYQAVEEEEEVFKTAQAHPCENGCQYAKDIGTYPWYTCAGKCQYENWPNMEPPEE